VLIEEIEIVWSEFYKHFPREFAFESKDGFKRNLYANNLKKLIDLAKSAHFKDAYTSVCTFDDNPPDGVMWDRNKAIADRIVFDIDVEVRGQIGLRIAFKNTCKLVDWLIKVADAYPLVKFSGSKGFHVEVPIPPKPVTSQILRAVGNYICTVNNIQVADTKVWEVARVFRLPLTINTKTGYYCIPLNPKKLDILTAQDIIHMSKMKIYHVPEVEEAPDFHEVVEKAHILIENTRPPPPDHNNHTTSNAEVDNHPDLRRLIQMILKAPNAHLVGKRYLNRAIYYTKVLVEKGSLSKDPLIVEIHSKSKWYKELAKKGKANKGAIEQLARVSFVLMLKTLGLTDEQIHEIFKHAEDYDYKKTQYFIEYNSKRLPEYLNSSYFLKTKALNP